jgi:hypothetical protein
VVGAPLIFEIALNVLRETNCRFREFAVWVRFGAQSALLRKSSMRGDYADAQNGPLINSESVGSGIIRIVVHPLRLSQC